MTYFLFNYEGDREDARAHVREERRPVALDEEHRGPVDAGDVALVYVAADRMFIARVELASDVRDGDTSEVQLADVEWWDPPASMDAVLSAIGPSEAAKGEFDTGVLWITDGEHDAESPWPEQVADRSRASTTDVSRCTVGRRRHPI